MYIVALAAGREIRGKCPSKSEIEIESQYVRSQRERKIQSKT
jgi:hypothetical protein